MRRGLHAATQSGGPSARQAASPPARQPVSPSARQPVSPSRLSSSGRRHMAIRPPGHALLGTARHCSALLGTARHCSALLGTARSTGAVYCEPFSATGSASTTPQVSQPRMLHSTTIIPKSRRFILGYTAVSYLWSTKVTRFRDPCKWTSHLYRGLSVPNNF